MATAKIKLKNKIDKKESPTENKKEESLALNNLRDTLIRSTLRGEGPWGFPSVKKSFRSF
jgi:hypothetical protein